MIHTYRNVIRPCRQLTVLRVTSYAHCPTEHSAVGAQCCRLRLTCDGTRTETRFRLLPKRTSPFKSAGPSVHSTTGSRGVRISGSNTGYTMFRGSMKSSGYPLHSPVSPSLSLPASPCAITFQLGSTSELKHGRLKTARCYPVGHPSPQLQIRLLSAVTRTFTKGDSSMFIDRNKTAAWVN